MDMCPYSKLYNPMASKKILSVPYENEAKMMLEDLEPSGKL
jgi:hypothetical protein